MLLKAILFDTRSIQKYIFAGTMLRTNIGASYLVDQVYEMGLRPALERVLGAREVDWDGWKKVDSPNWEAQETRARIGYIGGGNALVLLRADTDDDICRAIVGAFSCSLLTEAPGLKIGAAISTLELAADGSYPDKARSLTALVLKLKDTQNTVFPEVTIPYTGLTQACDVSGSAANAYSPELGRYVSAEVKAKLAVASRQGGKLAKTESALWENLTKVDGRLEKLSADYAFPTEFDKLGQCEGENDIAIVHIDGNNMGAKFAGLNTLTERKNRSRQIRQTTLKAFAALVQKIASELDSYDFIAVRKDKDTDQRYLPVRPLILGGDDMTFVCPAVLAVYFSEFIMRELYSSEVKIDSCGGIAILNTSYPFSRGYVLAEQACDAAKNRMRALAKQTNDRSREEWLKEHRGEADAWKDREVPSCYLEFLILHGEQAPTLEQIRESEYPGGLHFGPYRVDDDSSHYALAKLRQAVRGLAGLPRGKVKEMRDVLKRDRHSAQQFVAQLKFTGVHLPVIAGWESYASELWQERDGEKQTPWCDAIEMIDYIRELAKSEERE